MCPFCLSSLAWILLGGGAGSTTLAALIVGAQLRRTEKEENDGRDHQH